MKQAAAIASLLPEVEDEDGALAVGRAHLVPAAVPAHFEDAACVEEESKMYTGHSQYRKIILFIDSVVMTLIRMFLSSDLGCLTGCPILLGHCRLLLSARPD